jgi:hypothetical protein
MKKRLLPLITLIGLVSILIVMSSSRARNLQEIEPRITNTTNALRIIDVKKVEDGVSSDVEVTLLNQSSKNITAYMFSIGELSITTFASPFAQGETRIERIPFNNLGDTAARNSARASEIVLSAVYLEGGISEGETQSSNRLRERVLGIKEQVKRALSILQNVSNSLRPDAENVLNALDSQVSSLPVEDGSIKISPQRKGGRSWIKEKLQREIQHLKGKNRSGEGLDVGAALTELIASYTQLLAKL